MRSEWLQDAGCTQEHARGPEMPSATGVKSLIGFLGEIFVGFSWDLL